MNFHSRIGRTTRAYYTEASKYEILIQTDNAYFDLIYIKREKKIQ